MDFVQIEQMMENAFRITISQKFQFWMHRNLLNRFWKAMAQNIKCRKTNWICRIVSVN